MIRATCHDCGAQEGELHEYGCDMEKCLFCGGQLISCGCCYDYLGLRDHERYTAETSFLPAGIYEGGLNETQENEWLRILNSEGRIPFIFYPSICVYCGRLWPETFIVPDEQWKHYIEPAMQGQILCWPCYCWIRDLTDRYGRNKG